MVTFPEIQNKEFCMQRIFCMMLCLFSMFAVTAVTSSYAQSIDVAKVNTDCKRCVSSCQKALKYSQNKGGKYAEANHIRSLKDCIEACTSQESFLSRGSGLSKESAKLCIDACSKTATSCESLGDDTLKACADECRRLSESLKKVTGAEKP
jgi:hypothetical protein